MTARSRQAFVGLQWAGLLTLVGWMGWLAWRPKAMPEREPATWRSWEGFSAISYAGVARDAPDGRYPSPERLGEQLGALHAAGYRTVTVEDVARYLAGGGALPERALLLLFEGGRKDSVIRATPWLRRYGFVATMCVPTATTGWGDRFHLRRGEMRRVDRMPHWQFGSMGHEALTEWEDGGHFLTKRRRRGEEWEDDETYRQRVLGDYERSARVLDDALADPTGLYLYPFADAGRGAEADGLAEAVNREGVERRYRLGVVGADDPFNGPSSDPHALTRQRVPGAWTGEMLVSILDRHRPRGLDAGSLSDVNVWALENGMRWEQGRLRIAGSGAAWLLGTDGWEDVEVRAVFDVGIGAVGSVYVRYGGVRSYVRATVSIEGVRVQERLGDRLQTLFWRAWTPASDAPLPVRLRCKGNRVWIWAGGDTRAGPLPLTERTQTGCVGVGGAAGGDGSAERLVVIECEAVPLAARYAFGESFAQLEGQAEHLRGVLIDGWGLGGRAALSEGAAEDAILAASRGLEVIPVLDGAGRAVRAPHLQAEGVERALRTAGLGAVVKAVGLPGWQPELGTALRSRGLRVVHCVSGIVTGMLASVAGWEGDRVLFQEGDGDWNLARRAALRFLPPRRMMVSRAWAGDAEGAGIAVVDDFRGGGGQ